MNLILYALTSLGFPSSINSEQAHSPIIIVSSTASLQARIVIIENKKKDMISTLKEGLIGMIKMQGIITLLLIIFAEPLLIFLGYKGVSIWLFRILLIGVFFHVINLNFNIIFLYYEMRKEALLFTLLFALSNGIFTYISILLGTP